MEDGHAPRKNRIPPYRKELAADLKTIYGADNSYK